MKTKEEILRDAFALLTNGRIPDEIFLPYLNDDDGSGAMNLQQWCVDNMRGEIMEWCTGIGIIEAVEHLYNTAIENGNIKKHKEIECVHPFDRVISAGPFHNCTKCGKNITTTPQI